MANVSSAAEYLRHNGLLTTKSDFFSIFVVRSKMEEKRCFMKFTNYGQDCCAIEKQLTRNMKGSVFMKTQNGPSGILRKKKLMMIHCQKLLKSTLINFVKFIVCHLD